MMEIIAMGMPMELALSERRRTPNRVHTDRLHPKGEDRKEGEEGEEEGNDVDTIIIAKNEKMTDEKVNGST